MTGVQTCALPISAAATQEATSKKVKKISPTVIQWRNMKQNYPDSGIINFGPKPSDKRGKAKTRFGFYRDGMSVVEYVTVSHGAGNPKALAHADIRWDVVKGFITVT